MCPGCNRLYWVIDGPYCDCAADAQDVMAEMSFDDEGDPEELNFD